MDTRRILLLWVPPIIAVVNFLAGVAMVLGGYSLGVAVVIMAVLIIIGWMRFWGWLKL